MVLTTVSIVRCTNIQFIVHRSVEHKYIEQDFLLAKLKKNSIVDSELFSFLIF